MVPTSWYDTLWVNPRPASLQLEVTGRSAGVPLEMNKTSVAVSATTLAAAAGIHTQQNHPPQSPPPGGGIGGGSGDTARALVALNEAWDLHWAAHVQIPPVGGLDHSQHGLGLSEIDPAGQKGPQSELARPRQPRPAPQSDRSSNCSKGGDPRV